MCSWRQPRGGKSPLGAVLRRLGRAQHLLPRPCRHRQLWRRAHRRHQRHLQRRALLLWTLRAPAVRQVERAQRVSRARSRSVPLAQGARTFPLLCMLYLACVWRMQSCGITLPALMSGDLQCSAQRPLQRMSCRHELLSNFERFGVDFHGCAVQFNTTSWPKLGFDGQLLHSRVAQRKCRAVLCTPCTMRQA